MRTLRAAEFFAGIGLMRLGLAGGQIETSWANDIEAAKGKLYTANFGKDEFHLGDVRDVRGAQIPEIDIATASFPCIDLSLAGNRKGLGVQATAPEDGSGSSMFWEFARVLSEMGEGKPAAVLLENVLGFASSHGGRDLREAVLELNTLGYSCDLLALDARHFVPQSRPRMFIIGLRDPASATSFDDDVDRPKWARSFVEHHPKAKMHTWPLPPLPSGPRSLGRVVERLDPGASVWWTPEQVGRFIGSLSAIQSERLEKLRTAKRTNWRTAYRRTRDGSPVWEIRADHIAGCLRTARGGSSKQALVEAGADDLRIRWMLPKEYARLMGAPRFKLGDRPNQALFGFGDAVCVPVIRWLSQHYLVPALEAAQKDDAKADDAPAPTLIAA